jgi:site-specific recombinase XerD
VVVRSPGFEPGSSTWQADVLNHSSENSTELSVIPVARLRPRIDAMIANTLIKLQVNAKAQSTIKTNEYILKHTSKHVNLLEPEEVKKFVSEAKTKKGKPTVPETKNKWLFCYNNFCKYNGIKWQKPYYKVPEKAPLIPTTQDVQAIISNSSEKYVVVFTIESETGASPEELYQVTRDKINLEKREITITGVKGHGSKTYTLKTQTAQLLKAYLDKHPENQPFPKAHTQSQMFLQSKQKAYAKFHRQEILAIELRNLRNYAGERYYKSLPIRDAFAVQAFFRHKKISTTQHYLLAMKIEYEDYGNWRSLITVSLEEEAKAVEDGWQFVTRNGDRALYRKRRD